MKEIRALTGLRGIAALVVFLAHTRDTLSARGLSLHIPVIVERLCLMSGRQVDIFFVLSGFVLAMIYRHWFTESVARRTYEKFLQRRFARIYPLHAFMLILVILFVFAAYEFHVHTFNGLDRFSFANLPLYFLLIHGWGFLREDQLEWNPASWSVSIEALAYLVFPFYIMYTSRLEKSRPWTLFIAIVCCGFLLNAITYWGRTGYPAMARGLSEFFLGCIAAGFAGGAAAHWLEGRLGSLVAFAVFITCFLLTPDTGFVIAFFTAPLIVALCGNNWIAALFNNGPVYFLGVISYSIYLGQFLLTSIAYRLVSVEWMKSGSLQLVVGLSGIVLFVIGAATLTYYAVEKPGRDLLSGRRSTARHVPGEVGRKLSTDA